MKKTIAVAALAASIGLVGCTDPNDPNRRAKTGAAIGAVAGAVLGHQIHHGHGAYVGAAVGALAGAGVGHYMDKQQQELEAQLARERAAHELEIQRLQDDSLKVTFSNEVLFDFDSADLKYGFKSTLDKLASTLNKYPKTYVHVIGHTDNVGSADYNQRLSLRRAKAVAQYLVERGVDANRIYVEGRGEAEPRASNETEAGRQLNRRVEVILKPIVEQQGQNARQAPPAQPAPTNTPPRYY